MARDMFPANDAIPDHILIHQEENTMDEQKKIRRRTPQERAEAIDAKIAAHQDEIAAIEEKRNDAIKVFDDKVAAIQEKIKGLEARKKEILTPKPRRKTKKEKIKEILRAAEKMKMTPEEIAEKLGLDKPE